MRSTIIARYPIQVTRHCAAFLLATVIMRAQPAIGQNGVVNSASRIPPTLAGGAIARGALFTIQGVHLGAPGHSRVAISAGRQTIDAPVLSVSPERIEARMPASSSIGEASLIVTVDGQSSRPFSIQVAASNPGLFSRNGRGWGPGRIENIAPDGSRSENSMVNPAAPGARVAIFGTGFGNMRSVTFLIAGRMVKAARTASLGEERIELTLPSSTLRGCYVPVAAMASPQRASNFVTISVHAGPGPCQPYLLPAKSGVSVAVGVLSRTRVLTKTEAGETITDDAIFAVAKGDQPFLTPVLLTPPAGSCTAYTSSFQEESIPPSSISQALAKMLAGRGLDAGPQLGLTRDAETRMIRREPAVVGFYRGTLGQQGVGASRFWPPLFLNSGEIRMAGAGGKNLGPFEVRGIAPAGFEWLNRAALAEVDRSRPLTVRWRDSSPGRRVSILATNIDQVTTAMGMCLCSAPASAGEFTIPVAMLANLPKSRDMGGIPYDQLYVSSLDSAAQRIAGIDTSAVISIYSIGRFVRFK